MKSIAPILSLLAIPGLLSAEVVDGNKGELVLKHAADKEGDAPLPQEVNPVFTSSLYQQLRRTEGNVFFSPHSITEAMAMVHAGSGGNTATQIAKALNFRDKAPQVAHKLSRQREFFALTLNHGDNALNIANALCVTGNPPEQAYQDLIRKEYDGELFAGGLDKINAWVSKKTEGNIDKILEQLSPHSACVLLNAVYFKGKWQTPFKSRHTHKAPFHVADDQEVRVDMMMREGSYRVLREQGFIAVELPYQTSVSMILILPDKADGMEKLDWNYGNGKLTNLHNDLADAPMERAKLYLPKFKIATEYDLVQPMKDLGIKDAFSFEKSDFKIMYGQSQVRIAQIKHKATLEVDEAGSVAAAATAVELKEKSAMRPKPTPEIRMDRPFLVVISERRSGNSLFMGRISDPTK